MVGNCRRASPMLMHDSEASDGDVHTSNFTTTTATRMESLHLKSLEPNASQPLCVQNGRNLEANLRPKWKGIKALHTDFPPQWNRHGRLGGSNRGRAYVA